MAREAPSPVERALLASGSQKLVFGDGIDAAERSVLEEWRVLLTEEVRQLLDVPVVAGNPAPLLDELRRRWKEAG